MNVKLKTVQANNMKIGVKVIGKIFIKGNLTNVSPLALSSGEEKFSDADLFRDSKGNPMIPATSFVGALKSLLESRGFIDTYENEYHYLFGKNRNNKNGFDNSIQSHLIFDDLICTSESIQTKIRDGVKINHQTNLAVDQGKYDYEVLEPNHTFSVSGSITIREGVDETRITDFLTLIHKILSEDNLFQVGGLTSFGFGQLKAVSNLQYTGLLEKDKYLNFLSDKTKYWQDLSKKEILTEQNYATIEMELRPTTPFFIGGGDPHDFNTDNASLKSDGKYIVSAKSMKGAIRHQAYRIVNTLHGDAIAKDICNDIFGPRIDGKKNQLKKSAFWTSDVTINDASNSKAQTRVAIDRFTGGAIESALFTTEPVWPTDDTNVNLTWKLDLKKLETNGNAYVGLLLLVARDLMTEMLPVGGNKAVGRGRFEGKTATLNIDGSEHDIKLLKMDEETTKVINEKYIESLVKFKKNAQS